MGESSYLSVEDVARRFGVNPSTVYRLTQRGVLPAFKVGGQWRFSQDMLDSWVSGQVQHDRLRLERHRDASPQSLLAPDGPVDPRGNS
jgi:excisionase family DNA binding protein